MIPIVPIRKPQLKKKGILGMKLPSERKDCAWLRIQSGGQTETKI